VSDARIASAIDRAEIIRLRDIAATHRKQHAADLVRERSIWALSQVSGGRLIQPLTQALSSSDWRVRAYAAWALAATGDPSVVAALLSAMSDPHFRVRMHAVYGLERGGRSAVPALIRALGDSHWQVRIGAVNALTTIDDERAIESLRAIRQDEHPLVREEVAQALGKLER
jgi:HEAT repeat protein